MNGFLFYQRTLLTSAGHIVTVHPIETSTGHKNVSVKTDSLMRYYDLVLLYSSVKWPLT